jgi:hypothetical protein
MKSEDSSYMSVIYLLYMIKKMKHRASPSIIFTIKKEIPNKIPFLDLTIDPKHKELK